MEEEEEDIRKKRRFGGKGMGEYNILSTLICIILHACDISYGIGIPYTYKKSIRVTLNMHVITTIPFGHFKSYFENRRANMGLVDEIIGQLLEPRNGFYPISAKPRTGVEGQ